MTNAQQPHLRDRKQNQSERQGRHNWQVLFTLAWRYLWRNYRRTIINVIGNHGGRLGDDLHDRPDARHGR